MTAVATAWYCAKDGATQGPFTFEELQGMVRHGILAPTDHVWNQDLSGWIAASDQQGLFAGTSSSAPPPLPATSDPMALIPLATTASEPVRATPARPRTAMPLATGAATTTKPVSIGQTTATPLPQRTTPSVDPDIEKDVKNAVVAACISGGITALFTLIALAGFNPVGLDASAFIDVALIFGLAFGVHKKSRTCAVILLIYFIASKIYMMVQMGKPTGLPLALVFGYYYLKGVQATFKHHSK